MTCTDKFISLCAHRFIWRFSNVLTLAEQRTDAVGSLCAGRQCKTRGVCADAPCQNEARCDQTPDGQSYSCVCQPGACVGLKVCVHVKPDAAFSVLPTTYVGGWVGLKVCVRVDLHTANPMRAWVVRCACRWSLTMQCR